MDIEVHAATHDRFDDLALMLGPKKNADASVCWCLSHRIPAKLNQALRGSERGGFVRQLTRQPVAPGVLAYVDGEVAGWAAVAPRADLPIARSTKIPRIDDLPVWSVWCIRVRPGFRGRGVSHAALAGAVEYARSNGAPAVEGYPVDNRGAKVDLTMAFVGTRATFERAGFVEAAKTDAVAGGFPRVLMRRAFA
ncbi:GNAT family N-acetyltransferase [Ruicaihuangia caeni]|uniref:GNAT family N-acetyltransferase n=1 Tax=Ruicaihuangia caeni TaxID=3042517 RepID=UPI00338E3F70